MLTARQIKEVENIHSLMKSIGKVLVDQGFSSLGINVISEVSGVDKPFIYKRFGNFEGLLKAYIDKQDFWVRAFEEIEDLEIKDHRSIMKEVLKDLFNTMYKNEELQQILVWELGDSEGVTTKIAIERELFAKNLLNQTRSVLNDVGGDLNQIYALFISGIYYLVIHKDKSTFCEMDLNKKQESLSFIRTLNWLIDLIFDKLDELDEKKKIAKRALDKGIDVGTIAEITLLSEEAINELKK